TNDENDVEWVPFENLEAEGKAKVFGLELLVKPLLIRSEEQQASIEVVKSVMKLCRALLKGEGELLSDNSTCASFRTHLRLQAGLACIKLLEFPAYAPAFEIDDFNKISLLVQDQVYYVRNMFIESLCEALVYKKVAIKYAVWLLLAAHEPEADLKLRVKHFVQKRAKEQRDQDVSKRHALLEHHFVDFCFLLSHHPDFSTDKEDLKLFEAYVLFFLECLGTAENISYFYATASQMKTVRDKTMEDSTPLYVIAEMLIVMIREYCASQNWTLQTYPGKVGIPREIYSRLDDAKVAQNLKTVYYLDGEKRKILKQPKRQAGAPRTPVSSRHNDDSGSDSDATQVEVKRLKSTKDATTPVRRSERARKPILPVSAIDEEFEDV
ncbi:hypothetical protein HDU91_003842, partial [Kappamyces sp. JEL0680]